MSFLSRNARGGSKATATTTCQKCLKKGHYSYECKAAAQERPYTARPSRGQQLLNPNLRPKLTNNALSLVDTTKRGVLNEQAHKPQNGRKRSFEASKPDWRSRKRSRSISSYSSVATISTRSSGPRSLSRKERGDEHRSRNTLEVTRLGVGEKRRRRTSSVSSVEEKRPLLAQGALRNRESLDTGPRRGSLSPVERGRQKGRSALHGGVDIQDGVSKTVDASSSLLNAHTYERRDHQKDSRERQRSSHRTGFSGGSRAEKAQGQGNGHDRSPSPYSRRIALTRSMQA